MDEVERLAKEHRPKLLLAGWSAYPRVLDFPRFREIADEVGALLMVDMAHFAGLVAAGIHPSPVPHADVVTTTVHKTLGGPRSGLILCREEYAKKINSAVFPGQQGGPLEHAIAAKAVAFKIAASELFKERQRRTVDGAQALAGELLEAGNGVNVLTGGTDVHLVLVDLRESELDGQQAEDRLDSIGITVNRNAVPFDPRPPMVTSGLRIGTPALATRGLQVDDFHEVGKLIARALQPGFEDARAELTERVNAIVDRFPLYAHWVPPPRCRRRLTRRVSGPTEEHERRRPRAPEPARPRGRDPRPRACTGRRRSPASPTCSCRAWRPGARSTSPTSRGRSPPGSRSRATSRSTWTPRTARRSSCAPARRRLVRRADAERFGTALDAVRATDHGDAHARHDHAALERASLRRHRARAGVGDRAQDGGRDRDRALGGALPDALRGQPDADVGLRRRHAHVRARQRRRGPQVRLLARGVPRDADHRHPPAGGSRRGARGRQGPRRPGLAGTEGLAPPHEGRLGDRGRDHRGPDHVRGSPRRARAGQRRLGADAARAAARRCGEDGGDRAPGGRRRARLQQPADGDRRVRGDPATAWRRERGGGGDLARGGPGGRAHAPAAGLQPPPGPAPEGARPQRDRRGHGADAAPDHR